MAFWTYMLKCADDSFYIGHTDHLEQRMAAHGTGALRCYTSNRRPVSLVWSQEFATREEALAAERQLKGWSRKRKKRSCTETGRKSADWLGAQEMLFLRTLSEEPSVLRYLSTNGPWHLGGSTPLRLKTVQETRLD